MLRLALTLWLIASAAFGNEDVPLHRQYIEAHREAQAACWCLRSCAVQIQANHLLKGAQIPYFLSTTVDGQCGCHSTCESAISEMASIKKKACDWWGQDSGDEKDRSRFREMGCIADGDERNRRDFMDRLGRAGWTSAGEVLKRSDSRDHQRCFAPLKDRWTDDSEGALACARILSIPESDYTGIYRRAASIASTEENDAPSPLKLHEPEILDDAQDERGNLAAETGNELSHQSLMAQRELNLHANNWVTAQATLNETAVRGVAGLGSIKDEIRHRLADVSRVLERESYWNQQSLLEVKSSIDNAVRAATSVKQDPNLAVAQALREDHDLFKLYPNVAQIRFVIAMVPDPRVPRHKRGYSLAISGITRGLAAEQYFVDQYHFPWTRYIQTEDNGATDTVADAAKPEKFGLMVFRRDKDREANGCRSSQPENKTLCTELLAVYVVPEAVSYAFHRSSMLGALKRILWHQSARAISGLPQSPQVADVETISIIGPSFSSSVEPLRRAFGATLDDSPIMSEAYGALRDQAVREKFGRALRRERLASDRAYADCLAEDGYDEKEGANGRPDRDSQVSAFNTCGAYRIRKLQLDVIEDQFDSWITSRKGKSLFKQSETLAHIMDEFSVYANLRIQRDTSLGGKLARLTPEAIAHQYVFQVGLCPAFGLRGCRPSAPGSFVRPAEIRLTSPTANVESNDKYEIPGWFVLTKMRATGNRLNDSIVQALVGLGVKKEDTALIGEDSVFGRAGRQPIELYAFPPGIADVRANTPKRKASDRDVLPEFEQRRVAKLEDGVENGSEYPLSQRSLLATVGDSIMIQRALFEIARNKKAFILRFTDARDRIFMIEQIRAVAPNMLIIVPEYDDVMLHPDFRHVTRGVLMLRECPMGSGRICCSEYERRTESACLNQNLFQSDDEFYFALAARDATVESGSIGQSDLSILEIPNGVFLQPKSPHVVLMDYLSDALNHSTWFAPISPHHAGLWVLAFPSSLAWFPIGKLLILVALCCLYFYLSRRDLWGVLLPRSDGGRSVAIVAVSVACLAGLTSAALFMACLALQNYYSGPPVISGYGPVLFAQVASVAISLLLLGLSLTFRGGIRDLWSDFRRWGVVSGAIDPRGEFRPWAHLAKVRQIEGDWRAISLSSRPASILPLLDLLFGLIRRKWPNPAPDLFSDSEYTRCRWALRFSALILFVRGSALAAFACAAAGLLIGIWFPLAYANVYGITMLLLGFASLVVYVSASQYIEGFEELWGLLCDRKPQARTWVDLVRGSLLPLAGFMLLVAAVSTPGLAALSQPLFPFIQMIFGVK